jgi:hypothetical protein
MMDGGDRAHTDIVTDQEPGLQAGFPSGSRLLFGAAWVPPSMKKAWDNIGLAVWTV